MSSSRKAYLELHSAVFLFGFTGILGRLIELDAPVLVWHRMWLTAIFMFILVKVTKRWHAVKPQDLMRVFVISSFIAIHWVLFYASIKLAGVSLAMVCLSSISLFTAFLEPLVLRTRFSPIQFVFALLAIVGVYIMANEQQEQLTGILVGLASSFFSALFTVFNKRILPKFKPRMLSFLEISLGFIVLSILLPVFGLFFPFEFSAPTTYDWGYLLLLSLFCTVLAFNLSLNALNSLSAYTVNLAINLEPVYGIVLAFVIFKEHELLGTGFYIGTLFILLAVLGDTLWKRYQRSAQARTIPGSQP